LFSITAPLFISQILINSQYYFLLINKDSHISLPVDLSIFFKTKLDYYDFQKNKWIQYRPGLGVEIAKVFAKTKFGISFDFGYEKPINYMQKDFITQNFRSFGSIMIFFLSDKN
jgi:hypothetical protein